MALVRREIELHLADLLADERRMMSFTWPKVGCGPAARLFASTAGA